MSDTETVVFGVAERYATALFELAKEADQLDAVAADLDRFDAFLAESADLKRLIRSQVFSTEEQLRAITALLDKSGIGGLVGNFIKLVARNRRLFVIADMFRGYRAQLAVLRGELGADIVSAVPLSSAQLEDVKAALKDVTGKNIRVNARVDASLIGGLVVKVGSRMIDTSLKTKLDALKIALKEVG
ncbi:F0F1 ATP synthase subunit delta [Oryzibacter oryziterrae]|uniref:F0F1 ATP synthase subunit delta n=1 Tax=Oryzibacter oryziterrae TaxID=2766474 RepID=UPI001F2D4435|nr:F0F1 ATP synthase subunit delta [Oryzibacter oryziterrae]